MKIWLDDLRSMPEDYTIHVFSVNQAKRIIEEAEINGKSIDVIDCDHDLGDFYNDGGDGIKLLDWLLERGTFYPIKLHTANPVGRKNMQRLLDRFWSN